jgi:hypothetical protein
MDLRLLHLLSASCISAYSTRVHRNILRPNPPLPLSSRGLHFYQILAVARSIALAICLPIHNFISLHNHHTYLNHG